MPRLIDAEKLLKTIVSLESWNVPDFVYESINNATTIDADSLITKHEDIGYEKGYRDGYAEALEVTDDAKRHGHWIFNPKDAIEMMFTLPKCSECGAESSDGGNYCPNCGAKMEETCN